MDTPNPPPALEAGRMEAGQRVIELTGAPKSGFRPHLQATPTTLELASRLDPSLLYLVLGAAILLGVLGALLAAPDRSVLQAGLFVALCSPIALFLMFTALRVRFTCLVDRGRHELLIDERGYLGHSRRHYPLDEVGSVHLVVLPPSDPLGGGRNHLLCLAVPDGAYLLAESTSRSALEAIGAEIARYLGVPLDRSVQAIATVDRGRLLVGVLLYAAPVTAALAWLSVQIPESRSVLVLPTTLTAIVLSQVGAILALLYYRRHSADLPPDISFGLPPRGGVAGPLAGTDRRL